MIKNSFLVFCILFAIWSLVITSRPFSLFGHQWQENLVIAERFIFNESNIDNLVLGSSLAKRLVMNRIPGFYNLSFSGQGIFDGLNVLKFSKKIPKNLFIEINFIGRPENKSFKDIMFSPILNAIKKNIIVFRTDKQPLSALASFVLIPTAKKIKKTMHALNSMIINGKFIDNKIKVSSISKTIFEQNLELQKKIYSKRIDAIFFESFNRQLSILDKDVQYLKSKAVKIFFFEMPINRELIDLERASFIRKRTKEFFNGFDFIELPKNINLYKTTDGIHLREDESNIYTEYFKNEAGQILTKK